MHFIDIIRTSNRSLCGGYLSPIWALCPNFWMAVPDSGLTLLTGWRGLTWGSASWCLALRRAGLPCRAGAAAGAGLATGMPTRGAGGLAGAGFRARERINAAGWLSRRRRPARRGSRPPGTGQDAAPCRTNDLDPCRAVCSACPGTTAAGRAGFHPSLLRRDAWYGPVPEPEVPRRRHDLSPARAAGVGVGAWPVVTGWRWVAGPGWSSGLAAARVVQRWRGSRWGRRPGR